MEMGTFNLRYLFRAALGFLFVWAAMGKIGDLNAFAASVHNFRMLPASLETLFAMTLPWVELVAGLMLVLNLVPRAATALMILLLLVFLVALGNALYRNLDIDCGCFGTSDAGSTAWKTVARDIVFLALAVLGWPRRNDLKHNLEASAA